MMSTICNKVEKITKYNLSEYKLRGNEVHNTIAECTSYATKTLPIKAVVVSTTTGKLALDVSSLRPNAYIIAVVPNEKVAHELALKWGVYTKVVNASDDMDKLVKEGISAAKEMMNLSTGDLVIVAGGVPEEAHTNFMKIETI